MIWTHAMSGYIIKPRSLLFVKEVPPVVEFRFSLLLVSRQTYHETAVLPHRLNTIAFACFGDFNRYRDMWQLRFMRKMRIGIRVYSVRDDEDCTRLFPLEQLPALTEVDRYNLMYHMASWRRGTTSVQGRIKSTFGGEAGHDSVRPALARLAQNLAQPVGIVWRKFEVFINLQMGSSARPIVA